MKNVLTYSLFFVILFSCILYADAEGLNFIVEGKDDMPAIDILTPDFGVVEDVILEGDIFGFDYAVNSMPDNHSLTSDSQNNLYSPSVPLFIKDSRININYAVITSSLSYKDISKWEIFILDIFGDKAYTNKGKGIPPSILSLSRGDINDFKAGYAYSPVLIVNTDTENAYRFYGNTFVFDIIVLNFKDGSYKILMNTKSIYEDDGNLTPKGIGIIKGLKPICASLKSPSIEIIYNTNQKDKDRNVLLNMARIINKELLVSSKSIKADINYFSGILTPFAEITIKDNTD